MHFLALFSSLSLLCNVYAFYLPGVAPTDYEKDEKVPLLVNALSPRNIWGNSGLMSYDYYFKAFRFCRPENGPQKQSESLGSILFGDRIYDSPYELSMLKNESCKQLCSTTYEPRDHQFVRQRINYDFVQNWLIDGLPVVGYFSGVEGEEGFYNEIPLGELVFEERIDETFEGFDATLNNHFDFRIEYHPIKQDKYRVVGVTARPSSRNHKLDSSGKVETCESSDPVVIKAGNTEDSLAVTFTYSVTWVYSSTPWATRWDRYLSAYDPEIHWFSLVNSLVIVLFLVILVGTILVRALRKDIARYNEIDLSEEIQEDSGWKLLHGDVFRTPKRRMLLSVLVGSGAQLLVMVCVTLFFALLGFLSPSSRGSLSTVMIMCYVFFGTIGGYVSALVYRLFGGESWQLNLFLTPVVVPATIFGAVLLLNFMLIFKAASGAIPFGTLLFLVLLWFVVSVPLSAVGSLYAYKTEVPPLPVRTNQIPRQIPAQPSYLKTIPSFLLAGILPYEAIFIELYFILTSYWTHQFYYMFGFLFVCFILLVLTCGCVTVSLTYFSLCAENYHWQWRSFMLSGACSGYIFLHSIVYLVTKMHVQGFTSTVLYLGYSALISAVFFVFTGTVGFLSSLFFVRKIYSSIKID